MGVSWDGDTCSSPSVPDAETRLAGMLADVQAARRGCTRRGHYDRGGARRALALLRRGLWARLRYRRWRARPCPDGCGFWHVGPPGG